MRANPPVVETLRNVVQKGLYRDAIPKVIHRRVELMTHEKN